MNYNRLFMPVVGQHLGSSMAHNYSIFDMITKLGRDIKKINWSGLLSGVNKTLTTVNQTIPLIKQTKPMFDNVRGMIALTKAFRNETKDSPSNKINYKNDTLFKNHNSIKNKSYHVCTNDISDKPIFFI